MKEKNVFLNDKVAKKLFKSEKYGKVLSAKVISGVLDEDYETIYNNIKLSTEEIAFSSKTLNSTADAIYYDDVRYFDIEINLYQSKRKVRQLASYTYQLYLGQLPNHKNYEKIKKIVQISIDSYDYFNRDEFIYNVCFMEEKYHIKEDDDIKKIHINLAYLRKLDYNNIEISGNKLIHDLYFLICEDNKRLEDVYGKDNLMKEIVDESKKIAGTMELDLYLTDDEIRKLDQEDYYKEGFEKGKEDGIQQGIQQGIQEGIQKGILQNKKEMVINMYNDKVAIEVIAKYANLTISDVEDIIKS